MSPPTDPREQGKLILPPGIQEQGQRARRQNRRDRRLYTKPGTMDHKTASGIIIPDPSPSPEHYHVIYNVVRPEEDEISLPYWKQVFLSPTEAYDFIRDIGLKAEPNAEWYDNGSVGIETTMHERGQKLFWIILEPAQCVRSTCMANLRRENVKRSLFVLPGGKRK